MRVYLYDAEDLAEDRVSNFLHHLLQEKTKNTPTLIQTPSDSPQVPTLYPVSIAIALLWALTLGKTLLAWRS